jgi:hypothetical protein
VSEEKINLSFLALWFVGLYMDAWCFNHVLYVNNSSAFLIVSVQIASDYLFKRSEGKKQDAPG